MDVLGWSVLSVGHLDWVGCALAVLPDADVGLGQVLEAHVCAEGFAAHFLSLSLVIGLVVFDNLGGILLLSLSSLTEVLADLVAELLESSLCTSLVSVVIPLDLSASGWQDTLPSGFAVGKSGAESLEWVLIAKVNLLVDKALSELVLVALVWVRVGESDVSLDVSSGWHSCLVGVGDDLLVSAVGLASDLLGYGLSLRSVSLLVDPFLESSVSGLDLLVVDLDLDVGRHGGDQG